MFWTDSKHTGNIIQGNISVLSISIDVDCNIPTEKDYNQDQSNAVLWIYILDFGNSIINGVDILQENSNGNSVARSSGLCCSRRIDEAQRVISILNSTHLSRQS